MQTKLELSRKEVQSLLWIMADERIMALFSFSEREIDLITMRWREGMTFEQIAKKCNLTALTIKKNYDRFIRRLRFRILFFSDNYAAHEALIQENKILKSEIRELKLTIKEIALQLPFTKHNVLSMYVKISELDVHISVRAFNALRAANLETLGDIINLGRIKLSKISGVGTQTMAEIISILSDYESQF